MKKNINLLYLLCALLLANTGCSNEEPDMPPDLGSEKREIKLNASVEVTPLTKKLGPISKEIKADFPIAVFAHDGTWLTGESNYIFNDSAIVEAKAPNNIKFSRTYYYPPKGQALKFFAVAPGSPTSIITSDGASPVVQIPITGFDDVMWASAEGGKFNSDGTVSQPSLVFKHKLTQLQFKLALTDNANLIGSDLVSVQVMKQPNMINMSLNAGDYTHSGSINMEVISDEERKKRIYVAKTTPGTSIINIGSPIMTVPATGSEAYHISVYVMKRSGLGKFGDLGPITSYNAKVSINAEMGKAHVITLSFRSAGLATATSTVTDWEIGNAVDGKLL